MVSVNRRTVLGLGLAATALGVRAGVGIPIPLTGDMFGLKTSDLQRIIARPEKILAVYNALAPDPNAYIKSFLGPNFRTLENAGCFAIFASMVATNIAPYGNANVAPMAATLGQILASPYLACGHYCKLTTLLTMLGYAGIIPPDNAAWEGAKPTMHFLVWEANEPLNIGLHAQLVMYDVLSTAYLLIDPTYGFVMRLPYAAEYMAPANAVIVNAAGLLQVPTQQGDFVIVTPGGASVKRAQVLAGMQAGIMSPAYILHDALYGSEGWDTNLASAFKGMGSYAT